MTRIWKYQLVDHLAAAAFIEVERRRQMLFHNDLLQGVQVCMSASEDDDKSDGSSDLTWIVSSGKKINTR